MLILNNTQHSGYDNRACQTGRVIHDLYLLDSFYTRLGERTSVNLQPCMSKSLPYVMNGFNRPYLFRLAEHLLGSAI